MKLEEIRVKNYGTEMTRADFEAHFTKTREKVTFTFQGWDGKSYHGESRIGSVYRTDLEGLEDARVIKVVKNIHRILEDWMVLEEATGIEHPTTSWLAGVERA